MTDPLTAISAVDVIPAAEVDPAIAGIKAELAQLERELADLLGEAAAREGQLLEARRAAAADEGAVHLVERVLAGIVDATRADLRAALAQATEQAAEGVDAAQARAEDLLADTAMAVGADLIDPSTSWPPTGGDVTAPAATAAFEWVVRDAAPPEAPETEAPEADGPAATAAQAQGWDTRLDPPPFGPAPSPPGVPSAGPTAAPPHAPRAETAVDPFGKFWHQEPPTPPAKKPGFSWIDALLPVLAVAIMIVILLSWIG